MENHKAPEAHSDVKPVKRRPPLPTSNARIPQETLSHGDALANSGTALVWLRRL